MICAVCGLETVTSTNPKVDFCRFCHYSGAALDRVARFAKLGQLLRAIPGVKGAGVAHTGGGCFGFEVLLEDGRYAFGTMAYRMPGEPQWEADAVLPAPYQPWYVGVYPDGGDAFGSGEQESEHVPLSDDQFVSLVASLQNT